jgi:hypothetical protein
MVQCVGSTQSALHRNYYGGDEQGKREMSLAGWRLAAGGWWEEGVWAQPAVCVCGLVGAVGGDDGLVGAGVGQCGRA